MRAKDALGRYGEDAAVRHLIDAGLTIIERNWRCADGEIDIVASDSSELVICEVKTRSSLAFGDPAEAVVGPKAARLRRLAVHWLRSRDGDAYWPQLRFDVVTVLRAPNGEAEIRHIRGAF